MTILAWCLIGVGCFLLLYGFGILSVSERSDTDIKRGAEKEREDAIQQIFAEYRAKGEKLRQEAIRQTTLVKSWLIFGSLNFEWRGQAPAAT